MVAPVRFSPPVVAEREQAEGKEQQGQEKDMPALATNTIAAIARPMASTRIKRPFP
jgi:hypothetical protein